MLSISPGAQLPATSKVSEVREIDFDGTVIPTCHHVTQTYVSDGVPRHEKIESCQFGKWSYQINQTAPQADTSFDTIVDTLTARHAPMAQNLDACSVPNTQTPTAIDMDTADGNELMESVLGGKVITEAVLQGEAGLPGISPTFCLVNYLGTDPADLLIMRDKTSELTPLMVYPASLTGFMSPTPIMWVEKTVPLGVKGETETYALYSTFEDGVIRLHKLYAGSAPDDQTAALDILGILSGDTPMRAYLRRSERGDWSYHFASN